MFGTQEPKQYRPRTCSVPRNQKSTGTEHDWYPGTKKVQAQNMFGTQEPKKYRRRTCSVPKNQKSKGAEHVWYPGTSTGAEHVRYPGTKIVQVQNKLGTQEPKQYQHRTSSVPWNQNSTGTAHVRYPRVYIYIYT